MAENADGTGAIAGWEVSQRFFDALGLAGRRVSRLVLTIDMGDVVRVRFKEWVLSSRAVAQEVTEYPDAAQMEALTTVITSAVSGCVVERTRLDARQEEGALALDGLAERLARAVLAGDAGSALVLADLVQERYSEARGVAPGG